MAGYVRSETESDRAGANPLRVRAIGLRGFDSNPILSVADADRVLAENQKSGFLDQLAVVFIR